MPADENLTGKTAAKKLKYGIRWLTLSAVLAIASLGGWWVYSRTLKDSGSGVEVRLITVETDTLEEPINELGILELGDQRTLNSPRDSGIVEKILVNVGDRIEMGDELILLRSSDRDTKLLEHQYTMQQKELDLAKQRQLVEDAEANLSTKQATVQTLLIKYRTEAETQLEQKQLEIKNQQISLENQRKTVILAENDLELAQQKLQQLLNGDSGETRTQIRQKQVEIQKAELNLENLRQQVAEAELQLAESQETLQQDEALYARDFIAENKLKDSRRSVRESIANLQDTQREVKKATIDLDNARLDLQNLEEQVAEEILTAQREVQAKQLNLEQEQLAIQTQTNALNKLYVDLQVIKEDLEDNISEAIDELQQAEVTLRDAKNSLQNTEIEFKKNQLTRQNIEKEILDSIVTAPISGKVLKINVASGDVVNSNEELLIIGDPNKEIVKLQLSTLNAAKVQPNQLARISLAGPDEESFPGYVESVSLVASSEQSGSSNSDGGTVEATVRLDSPSGSFIPGSRVSVDIILEQRQDVLAVETSAVQNLGSDPFVWIRDVEGKAQKKSVTLGLEDLTNGLVEVTEGLNPGDEVILPPVDVELEAGMPVKEFKPEENQPGENSRSRRPRGRRRRGN
jgi:HlyD family secretion protein